MENFRVKLKQSCCFLPKFIFKCIGISFDGQEGKLYHTYTATMLLVNLTYGYSSLHSALHNIDNFDVVINNVFNIFAGWMGFLIACVMVYHRKTLGKVLKELDRIQEQRNTDEWGQKIVYSVNKKILGVVIAFGLSLCFIYTSTLVKRFVEKDGQKWTTPTVDITVINKTYSPNFEIAWAYQVFGVTTVATCFCISDFFVASIMVDLTVQFKILRKNIKRTLNFAVNNVNKSNYEYREDKVWKYLQKHIKEIIIYHLSLINLANDAESVCSKIALLNVIGNLAMIGSSLYYASVLPLFDARAMDPYVEVSMLIMALFFVCYWGTQVSLASESVGAACYEINFVGTNIRFQRDLLMVMMRCQKPIKLTVGKFTVLSIAVFVWIIRTSYSYLMVLRKSNQDIIIK